MGHFIPRKLLNIATIVVTAMVTTSAMGEETTRRGFFKKLRDNYIAGRLEAAATKEEKRIIERRENEKLRRRAVYERNVKTLVDGISKRLRQRSGHIKLVIVGSVALIIWLCHKGSIGCDRDKEHVLIRPHTDGNPCY